MTGRSIKSNGHERKSSDARPACPAKLDGVPDDLMDCFDQQPLCVQQALIEIFEDWDEDSAREIIETLLQNIKEGRLVFDGYDDDGEPKLKEVKKFRELKKFRFKGRAKQSGHKRVRA